MGGFRNGAENTRVAGKADRLLGAAVDHVTQRIRHLARPSDTVPLLAMIPLFGNERRRQINLGGSSSASSISHTTILNQAKQRRLEREDNRRRHDNAIRLQAWWRGMRESRITRNEMRKLFMENVTSLTGLRCMVLIRDEEILGIWSSAMIESGEGRLHLRFYY